ncbi:MAG TPA: Ig-like domain-containing protein [Candidatus Acidoferrum sp.]|nr:Ig-like domain-containing protein [Candidatus Acidoferrum sp.]
MSYEIGTRNSRSTAKHLASAFSFLLCAILCFGLAGCAGLVSAGNGTTKTPPPGNLSISAVQGVAATVTGFQVDWTTNVAANSAVDYGTSSSYGNTTPVNSSMVTSHQIGLTGLKPTTQYHFRVRSTDSSGASASSGDATFSTAADTTPPTVAISSPAQNATISGTATVSATASDNIGVANVQFKVDGINTGAPVSSAPYSYSLNTAAFANGNHSLTALATDTSGNTATSASVTVNVSNNTTSAPSITSLSPTSGLIGVAVTIAGTNLGATQGTSTVKFNGTVATPTSWNATSIVAAVPTGATSGNVVVTVGGVTSNGVNFTVTTPAPSIMSLSPASGAVGTSVTISGANLGAAQGTSTVRFNGTTATPTSWSATSIGVPVPSGATTGSVVVTVGGVASNGATFTVQTSADTTPPSVPAGLTAAAASSSQINLSWNASTDNVGVTGYNIYRAGTKIGTSASTSYQDTGLAASTTYTYTVSAFDAAGNTSAQSSSASATTQAGSSGGGLPSSLGWYQIPNTTMQSVCPPNNFGGSGYAFSDGCHAVVDAWGGGAADTSRNRLIVWGGGHSDYSGNEIYALDLNSLTVSRLNNPALPLSSGCTEALTGPSPNSRHSYDDLAYVPGADQLMVVTGSMAPTGCASTATWTLNMGTLAWTQQSSAGTAPNFSGGLAAISYDPNSKLVYVSSEAYASFASYNLSTNTYTMLNSHALSDYHETSVIDPSRKLFLMFGAGNAYKIDISGNDPNYTLTNISATGCGFVSAVYPGVAYDSSQNLVVGWSGGNTVYLYNPTTDSCTSVTYPNGPGAAQANGTFKRFSYFPALNVFALVNSMTQNAYALRLTNGSGTGTGPNISGVNAASITSSGATISWTTDVAATTQVEYGTTTAYGTLTTLNSSLVTSHSQALTGLTASTLYHYRVHSKNSSGIETISGDFVFSTSSGTTVLPPTVSVTAPAAGATVSGTTTISASASSSIGIAKVQFAVDGVNVGSAVTTSPYQTSWDSTTVSNGAHSISATATDTAGTSSVATPVTVTVSNSSTGQSTNYQQRCAAAGVLLCMSLDSQTQLNNTPTASQNWYPAADGVFRCNIDSTVFPPDGPTGSLNCVVPPQIGANASGNVNNPLGGTFGPAGDPNAANGNTFYIQLRERMDPNFVALHTDGEGFKLFGVHGMNPDSTCQSVGIVIQNEWWRGMPTGFVNCGAQSLEPVNNGPTSAEQLEQGYYTCTYGAPGPYTLPNCFQFMANQWMTFEMKVVINKWDASGTLPGNGSNTIMVWGAYEGQPLHTFISLTNFPINFQNSAGDVFSKFIVYDYDTNRTTTSSYPTANCWYSEVIVSTQPIPAPDGPTVQ